MANLIIRAQQWNVLEEDVLCRWIAAYLARSYPDSAGETAELEEFVRQCVADGRKRGFTDRLHLRKYVHVSFLLGRNFASAPELAWARAILDNPDYHDQGARLRTLEDSAIRHLAKREARAPKEGG